VNIFSDSSANRKNEEIVELVFNECKKENVNYRMVALQTLGELLEKLKIDKFAQTYQLVMHIIQKVYLSTIYYLPRKKQLSNLIQFVFLEFRRFR